MAMKKQITIDPVTRLEGHGKIVVNLGESGKVEDAYFSVAEFRGFEKFCEGRMLWEMPTITSRICGVCPVSHHLASVKATEALLGVEIPTAAVKLRELLHMGQLIHSHSLHFFFFALPDFLYVDSQPVESRSVLGLLSTNKALAASAIKLRKAGQDISDVVGGGRLHPVACLPGGMSKPLDNYSRVDLLRGLLSVMNIAQKAVKMVKELYQKNADTFKTFASFPSSYMGLTNNGKLEMYEGNIGMMNSDGKMTCEFKAADYLKHIHERVDTRSWTKLPYYLAGNTEREFYRVACLARANIATSASTPLADAELQEFKKIGNGKPIQSSLFYHYARMIELLYAAERAKELLMDPEILSTDVRIPVKRRGGEGVGVIEAPRGTLFHHYWANDDGRITKANIIVSTAHNMVAMNQSIKAVAETIIKDGDIPEKLLNKLEMAIRCYDPCLSCSSHAYGRMPLEITINRPDGSVRSYEYGDLKK